jgi:hypothetical protein
MSWLGARLRPVILATQEAEIRRIMVLNQPWANSSLPSMLKNLSQKMADGVVQSVDPEFKPQYRKKKKKKKNVGPGRYLFHGQVMCTRQLIITLSFCLPSGCREVHPCPPAARGLTLPFAVSAWSALGQLSCVELGLIIVYFSTLVALFSPGLAMFSSSCCLLWAS